jgi:hypothetical protein
VQALKLGEAHKGPGFNGREQTFPSYIHVELSRCASTLAVRVARGLCVIVYDCVCVRDSKWAFTHSRLSRSHKQLNNKSA